MQARRTTVDTEKLRNTMRMTGIPSLSSAAFDRKGIHSPITLGTVDAKSNPSILITAETVYQAASLSKPLFAYLVLRLAVQNRFDLDKPLGEILPHPRLGKHEFSQALTARLVLSHQTGFPNIDFGPDQPFEFQFKAEFGQHYAYSGAAYFYLQKAIEKHTGQSLEQLAEKEVFQHVGMKHTHFESARFEVGTIFAVPHDDEMNPQANHTLDQSPAHAAKSLCTTANDYALFLAKWMKESESNAILKSAFDGAVSMTKDQWAIDQNVLAEDLKNVFWGLGWGLQKTSQGTIAFHWGDMGDSKAFVAIDVTRHTGIVYFANSWNGLAIARDIVSSIGIDLDSGFNYLFKKYGYEDHHQQGWKERQNYQTVANFGKYERNNKPGWQDELSDRLKRYLQPSFSNVNKSSTASMMTMMGQETIAEHLPDKMSVGEFNQTIDVASRTNTTDDAAKQNISESARDQDLGMQ